MGVAVHLLEQAGQGHLLLMLLRKWVCCVARKLLLLLKCAGCCSSIPASYARVLLRPPCLRMCCQLLR